MIDQGTLVWFSGAAYGTSDRVSMVGEVLTKPEWSLTPWTTKRSICVVGLDDGLRHWLDESDVQSLEIRGTEDMGRKKAETYSPLVVGELVWLPDRSVMKVKEYYENNDLGYEVVGRRINDRLATVYTLRRFVEPCAIRKEKL